MATISVDKENGVIVYTDDDGTTRAVTIRREDCVISAVLEGYEEVELLRYNTATGYLEVIHNGTVLEVGAGAGVGDMLKSVYDTDDSGVVDNSEQLGGDSLADVESTMDSKVIDHIAAADPHTAYVLKSLFDTGTLLYAAASGNPEAKTRAELIALLSGQAGAAFDWNGQDLGNIGHIGLGGNPANVHCAIYHTESMLIGDNIGKAGIIIDIDGAKTLAAYGASLKGLEFNAYVDGAINTQDWTGVIGLRGVSGIVGTFAGAAATKIITGIASLYAESDIRGTTVNELSVTNYYGLYVSAVPLVGNSKLTNDYGIYVGAQTGGAVLNYAIYTNNGLVHFGDNVGLAAGKTVDGRDVSVDGAKLDLIEANATKYPDTGEQAFLDADHTKLDGIASGADVTGSNTPQAHKASHQNAGADEISVAGLSGLLADDQHVLDTEVTAVAIALTQKAAASGVASLNASTKVVEQPASVTDHLEGTPTEDLATKAPTSEWAFDHDAATTGIHGVSTNHVAATHTAGQLANNIVWLDASSQPLSDLNRTATLGWTDLDLTGATSANAKFAIIELHTVVDSIGADGYSLFGLRKNGTTPVAYPRCRAEYPSGHRDGARAYLFVIVALDAAQVLEYAIIIGGTIQVDNYIRLLGYIE